MNGYVVFAGPRVDVRPELEHVPPGPRVGAGAVAVVDEDLERWQVAPALGVNSIGLKSCPKIGPKKRSRSKLKGIPKTASRFTG